jgi:hypothetical protein
MRIVGGLLGLLAAVPLAVIGLLLILYRGDVRGGAEQDIDISFWDTVTVDADLVGSALIIVAAALVLASTRLLRRSRVP